MDNIACFKYNKERNTRIGVFALSQQLKGKTALITGAGKGIGRATAIALAKEGVHVGLMARTEADLQKVAEEVKQEGVNASIATADIASNEQVTKAVEQLKGDLGSIDILINNAGTSKFGGFLELEVAEWENIIQVNLLGMRSEEHTSELQSRGHLVCRLLLEKKKDNIHPSVIESK